MLNRTVLLIAILLLIVLGGGAWYFLSQSTNDGSKNGQDSSNTDTSRDTDPNTPSDNSPKPSDQNDQSQNKTYQVSVYFSRHPESDNDPGAVFPVTRTSPDLGVADFAIRELLKGPTADEAEKGYYTTARLRDGTGTDDFKLSINDGTATLQFLRQFDHVGSVSDGQAESVLKATLLQFSTVNKVIVLDASGNCEFDLSGMNKCLE